MSWLYEDPDEWEMLPTGATYSDKPGTKLSYDVNGAARRKRTPQEVALIKARRIADQEDSILAQADIIRADRLAREPRQAAGEQPDERAQIDALMLELVALRSDAADRDAPAWRANVNLNLKLQLLQAPLEQIARMQLVTNNWTNASLLSSAIRIAERALVAVAAE